MIDYQIFTPPFTDGVVDVILPIQCGEFGVAITLADQPDLLHIPEIYQTRQGNFWIARDGNQVIGTIGLIDVGDHQGVIRKMFVRKAYRGKEHGVAQHLLDTLLDWCRTRGFQTVQLGTVDRYHAALRFYEKNGFTRVEKAALPDTFPFMTVDNVFYQQILR